MAFLLGFFLEALMGMIGFWTLEVSSLLWIYMLFNFFLSGQMFPLSILPAPWDTRGAGDSAAVSGVFSGGGVFAEDQRAPRCGRDWRSRRFGS